MDICVNCSQRKASLDWVGDGGAMAYVHGMSVRWCERCAVEAQLQYARARAKEIAGLEKRLAELS